MSVRLKCVYPPVSPVKVRVRVKVRVKKRVSESEG